VSDLQTAGRAIHWVILVFAAVVLARRLIRGSFGPGFYLSTTATALALAFVTAGLIVSGARDFGGEDTSAARAAIVADCTSQGETARVCGCLADELLEHTDDIARLTALSQQIGDVRAAGVSACVKVSDAPG